jgi:hypothetical protein
MTWRNNADASLGATSVQLLRDGADDVLALQRTTNAQTFRIYNTYTDASNYERGFLRWSSNVFQIGTEKGSGGGSARALEFQTDGVTRMTIAASGVVTIGPTASINGMSIGNGQYRFSSISSFMSSPADGNIALFNSGGSTFDRLQFGGTSASFPALKRSSATLQVRLADDSAFGALECGALTLNGNLTASTRNIVTDTTTGTRIGTGTTQLLGFWNATPAAQPAAVADATDAASTQARLNDLLSRLRTIGIIAT